MKHNWEYKILTDCIEKVKYTNKIQSSDYKKEGLYPIISQEDEYISGYCDNESDLFKISKPIVIFGDHTRIVKYIDFDFVLGADGVKILQPIDNLSAKFFSYFLKSYPIPSLGYSRHFKVIKEISVPLPPLSTQQSIVSELDSLSKIIADCKETLKDYDALEQSIFYDMFGDPVKNDKGWDVKKLGEVCDVKGGYAFKSENFKNIGIPVLRIGNINSGYFTQNNMVFWDEDDTLEKYAIYPGEMVMSLTGTVGKDDYGNLCILGSDYKKYYLNQRNAKLQLHNDLDKWMLFFLLKNKEIKGILTGVSRGVRQANIANRDIENLKIILPPLHYQQQFASKIEAIEQMKSETKKALQEAETLFQARMDYWFG